MDQEAHQAAMELKLRVLVPLIKDMLQVRPHMVIQGLIMELLAAAVLEVWVVTAQQVQAELEVWALPQVFLGRLFFMRVEVVVLHTVAGQ